jgi:hypothetical protein
MAALDGNARALLLHHAQLPSNLYCQGEPRNSVGYPLRWLSRSSDSIDRSPVSIFIAGVTTALQSAPVGSTIGRLWLDELAADLYSSACIHTHGQLGSVATRAAGRDLLLRVTVDSFFLKRGKWLEGMEEFMTRYNPA